MTRRAPRRRAQNGETRATPSASPGSSSRNAKSARGRDVPGGSVGGRVGLRAGAGTRRRTPAASAPPSPRGSSSGRRAEPRARPASRASGAASDADRDVEPARAAVRARNGPVARTMSGPRRRRARRDTRRPARRRRVTLSDPLARDERRRAACPAAVPRPRPPDAASGVALREADLVEKPVARPEARLEHGLGDRYGKRYRASSPDSSSMSVNARSPCWTSTIRSCRPSVLVDGAEQVAVALRRPEVVAGSPVRSANASNSSMPSRTSAISSALSNWRRKAPVDAGVVSVAGRGRASRTTTSEAGPRREERSGAADDACRRR